MAIRDDEAFQRAIACKAQRQCRHAWQRWECRICKLQSHKGIRGFESHSLRHPPTLAGEFSARFGAMASLTR
jgi:hypothetical protein